MKSSSEEQDYIVHRGSNLATYGYSLLFFCWLVFVAGVGGILGLWDKIFETDGIADLACYFTLIIVTGFVWTILNWYHKQERD